MEKLLTQIIKIDSEARERLKEAEEYRKKRMAQLPLIKEEIIKIENQKAIDEAMSRSLSSSTAAAGKLEQTKERNKLSQEKMEALYEEKVDEWVDTLVKNIITP